MKKYSEEEHLSFDDILLIPQRSGVASRKDVSVRSVIGNGSKRSISLKLPLIAAPMDTVCEWQMAAAMRKAGGLGIIHRYMTVEQQAEQIRLAAATAGRVVGGSVGTKGTFLSDATLLTESGAALILVDTANGHNDYAINAVKHLRNAFGRDLHIMAGNVSTWDGFARLADAGADSVRVGIGGGSACTTRVVSGHGMPTLASIMDIRANFKYGDGPDIIADGGIRNSGDAAKALAAGANAVMVGRLLAGTTESPGEIVDGKKIFRGMASAEAQADGLKAISGVEGIATTVPFIGDVQDVLDDFEAGLKSALSYAGAEDLIDFYNLSVYNRVSGNSLHETKPHAKE